MITAIIVDDEPLPRERIRTLLAGRDVSIVAECADGASAVHAIAEHRPDLVFLDVQMPEADGFEVLEALDPEEWPAAVVFVTAYDEHAVRAFEVAATDFLLKPIRPDRFAQAVDRAIQHIAQPRAPARDRWDDLLDAMSARAAPLRRFVVRQGSRMYFVRIEDVIWIEAAANYVRLHTGDGGRHLVRSTMKRLATQLDPDVFVRVHRSAIVNVDCIASVEPHTHGEYAVTLRDGTRLTTSRGFSDELRALLREPPRRA